MAKLKKKLSVLDFVLRQSCIINLADSAKHIAALRKPRYVIVCKCETFLSHKLLCKVTAVCYFG